MSDSEGPKFRVEPLDPDRHERAAFACEQDSLTSYIKQRANQDAKKRIAAVYVMTPDGHTIAGYYTLSQYAVDVGDLTAELARKLRIPKYDVLPATLLGRLARDLKFKAQGLGEMLLMSALKLALDHSKNIASLAVVVDAIDEKAREFYLKYGFIDVEGHTNRLFLPMQSIQQLFPDPRTDNPNEGSSQSASL